MSGSIDAGQVHRQYSDGISAFRRQIAAPELGAQFAREVDGFMRACALGVWKEDGSAVTPRHVEYYNAIYTRGNQPPSALFWELSTAVAEFPGFRPPDFFERMLEQDRRTGGTLARRFIDLTVLMLLLFAAVDDVVSEEEAAFVNRCARQMSAALGPGEQGHAGLDASEFVTRRAPLAGRDTGVPAGEKQEAQAEEEPLPTLEELLAELEGLCGLDKVKADVKSLINLVKVRRLRREHQLPVPPMSLHLVFLGNPGTGKTTVARLLAGIYRAIGVLSKGQLVEVDRSGLVAGFVGQTAIKTSQMIEKALGGVLFIDEAYALANQDAPNDFGREAIETLLKAMEDHREDFIVIVAGYTGLMEQFIHANPGLESRFNKYFFFEDYNGAQLMEIFSSMCRKNGYTIDDNGAKYASEYFDSLYENRDENFGNARDVRNLFERAVARQSDRVAGLEHPDRETLMALTVEDLREEG